MKSSRRRRSRENGAEAINEYLENKSAFVELAGGTRDPFKLG